MPRHSPKHSSRPRRRIPRWLKVSLIGGLILANVAVLGVWWTLRQAELAFWENATQLDDVTAELTATTPRQPLYVLVIGSDSRAGVDTGVYGDFGGARSDVVMVARVDAHEGDFHLLSIPRDTLVPIEGHGEDKVNSAFAFGGAPLMVKTVGEAFDVPIHHYVEVDFVGFQALVDELGGVEVAFAHPARDAKSRLDVPAGMVTLDGAQALAFARSRLYQEFRDGTWRSVDASDIGRMQRQQQLLLAILSRLKTPSTLTEPGSVVASFARHLTVDSALAEASLAQLAFSMRGVGPADIETLTLPTVGANRNGASVLLPARPGADQVLEAFRAGGPMDPGPVADIVNVRVLNGNGVDGSARRWAADLEAAGYVLTGVENAGVTQADTAVVVDAGHEASAADLVQDLGFGRVVVGRLDGEADAIVILGADAEAAS